MPTYKHPCPHCGNFIERDVKRCPFCAAIDPFTPGRCPTCRAPLDDLRYLACPKCGAALREGVAPMPTPGPVPGVPNMAPTATPGAGAIPGWGTTGAVPPAPAGPAPTPAAAAASSVPINPPPPTIAPAPVAPPPPPAPPVVNTSAGACSGCGAALAPGARFCSVCGTVAG
jgi:hypothetical protein